MRKHAVLLLIDLINDSFVSDSSENLKKKLPNLIANVNQLIGVARVRDWPIIWVKEAYKALDEMPSEKRKKAEEKKEKYRIEPGPIEGTFRADFLSGLQRKPEDDKLVVKKNYGAFFNTDVDLDRILMQYLPSDIRPDKSARPRIVIIAGVNTHACVHTTAVDAYQRDYEVIFAADCIASWNEEFHRVFKKYQNMSIGTYKDNLEIEDYVLKRMTEPIPQPFQI